VSARPPIEATPAAPEATVTTGPEIELGEGAELDDDLSDLAGLASTQGDPDPSGESEAARRMAMRSAAAMELRTFVVPEGVLPTHSTPEERTTFIEERLAHRLPCPVAQVRRVDVHLFEPGAVLVRVWCRVD
jgi:hypothetical protein